MSVIRQQNWLGQQRVDLPHLRSLESAVAADFDVLVGQGMAGSKALVVRGFEMTGVAAGTPATSLSIVTAGGIAFNRLATEAGTFLSVPSDRAAEVLNPVTNGRVVGGWVLGATNYIGLGYVRSADVSTTDLVQFISSTTRLESPRQVPLGKTLDYQIEIVATPFSSQTHLVPIAKVVLDASGFVVSVEDARPLMFRLGQGGDNPQALSSFSSWTRTEGSTAIDNTLFQGGDKTITSQKDWMDAVMTRIWESGGGEHWYSATADRNVTLITYGATLGNGEYLSWNLGTETLTYQGLRLLFDNSTAYSNDIASGSVVGLKAGEVLYVDADRTKFYAAAWAATTAYVAGDIVVKSSLAYEATVAGTSGGGGPSGTGVAIVDGTVTWKYVGPGVAGGLVATRAALATLGTGSPAGSRWILAWRRADQIFVRGWRYPVGTLFTPANTAAQGVLKITRDYAGLNVAGLSSLNNPVAVSDRGGVIETVTSQAGLLVNLAQNAYAAAWTPDGAALLGAGLDTVDSCIGVIGFGSVKSGIGILGIGTSATGAASPTVWAGSGIVGWATGGAGVYGDGVKSGGIGLGSSSTAPAAANTGVRGRGATTGYGVVGISGNDATAGGGFFAGGHAGASGLIATIKDVAVPTGQAALKAGGGAQIAAILENNSAATPTATFENLQTLTGGGAISAIGDSAAVPTITTFNVDGIALSAENESATAATVSLLNNLGGPALELENSGTGASINYINSSSAGSAFVGGKAMKKLMAGTDFIHVIPSANVPAFTYNLTATSNGITTGVLTGSGNCTFLATWTLPLRSVITSVRARVTHTGTGAGGVTAATAEIWKTVQDPAAANGSGVAGWANLAALTGVIALGLNATATSETLTLAVNATASNRTVNATTDKFTMAMSMTGLVSSSYQIDWVEINYTMYDTLAI